MIVLGADTHKRSHTIAAVVAATGDLRDEKTVAGGVRGFNEWLSWGRGLAEQRRVGARGLPACVGLV